MVWTGRSAEERGHLQPEHRGCPGLRQLTAEARGGGRRAERLRRAYVRCTWDCLRVIKWERGTERERRPRRRQLGQLTWPPCRRRRRLRRCWWCRRGAAPRCLSPLPCSSAPAGGGPCASGALSAECPACRWLGAAPARRGQRRPTSRRPPRPWCARPVAQRDTGSAPGAAEWRGGQARKRRAKGGGWGQEHAALASGVGRVGRRWWRMHGRLVLWH